MCDVCLDGDTEFDNAIVMCELCNVAVHQTCYGWELTCSIP